MGCLEDPKAAMKAHIPMQPGGRAIFITVPYEVCFRIHETSRLIFPTQLSLEVRFPLAGASFRMTSRRSIKVDVHHYMYGACTEPLA